MKKIMFALLISTMILTSCGKSLTMQELPQPVQSEFIKRYKSAQDTEWKYYKKKDIYKAKFKLNGKKTKIQMSGDGKVKKVDN